MEQIEKHSQNCRHYSDEWASLHLYSPGCRNLILIVNYVRYVERSPRATPGEIKSGSIKKAVEFVLLIVK